MKLAPQPAGQRPVRDSVKIHIEELVLHGFAPSDRQRIAHAVETELARLMGEGAQPRWRQNPPSVDRINAGAFKVTAGAKPQAAGREIARAVFRSLRQHSRGSTRALQARPGVGGRPM